LQKAQKDVSDAIEDGRARLEQTTQALNKRHGAELEALRKACDAPTHPVLAIVGGSKISTKLDLLKNISAKVDYLVLGGAMANTFLAAQGKNMGASMVESDMLDTARTIMAQSTARGCTIILPSDVVAATAVKPNIPTQIVPSDAIASDAMALDAGPDSIARINSVIDGVKTVLWNGPLGVFEVPPFERATCAVAQHVAVLTKAGKLVSVAGGGDTAAAMNMAGVTPSFSYVSMAGGAFLEWLEGKELPGVAALQTSR
jgi:phosphoglycerate kinase